MHGNFKAPRRALRVVLNVDRELADVPGLPLGVHRDHRRNAARECRRQQLVWGRPVSVPPREAGSSVMIGWRPLTSTSCLSVPFTRRAVAVIAINKHTSTQRCSCARMPIDGIARHDHCDSAPASGSADRTDRRTVPGARRADAHQPARGASGRGGHRTRPSGCDRRFAAERLQAPRGAAPDRDRRAAKGGQLLGLLDLRSDGLLAV